MKKQFPIGDCFFSKLEINMKAIIFAAGLGTRLKPLTDNCPKALVPLNGKPLLWHAIKNLEKYGINEIVVNIHHFGEQIIDYIQQNQFEAIIHISDEREELLDTGGGLIKARPFFSDEAPIIAYNVDVISSVDISAVVAYHLKEQALATLVVRERETSRYFMFNEDMHMMGWKNYSTGEEIVSRIGFSHSSPWAFSGIQVLSPKIFDLIAEEGKFSVTPLYLRLAQSHKIIGYPDGSPFWMDLGKLDQLAQAEKYLFERQ
jgi:NDP-sugar pyrophosphorylase family protein